MDAQIRAQIGWSTQNEQEISAALDMAVREINKFLASHPGLVMCGVCGRKALLRPVSDIIDQLTRSAEAGKSAEIIQLLRELMVHKADNWVDELVTRAHQLADPTRRFLMKHIQLRWDSDSPTRRTIITIVEPSA